MSKLGQKGESGRLKKKNLGCSVAGPLLQNLFEEINLNKRLAFTTSWALLKHWFTVDNGG